MYKSEITAVFLAAILFTGALTAAIPSFMGIAEASGDKKDKKDKYADSDDEREYKYKDKYGYSDSKEKTSEYKKDKYADSGDPRDYNYKLKYEYSDLNEKKTSDNKYRDYNYLSSSYDKSSEKRDKNDYDHKDSRYDKYSRDHDKKTNEYKNSYSKGKGTYDESYSYGQVYTKPSYGTDYDNDNNYDKKIINKIIVVCPDGSKIPIREENSGYINPRGLSGGAENGFIDNVIEKVCPALDSCEECFGWLLNFADSRTEAISVLNVLVKALNDQNPGGTSGKPNLEKVEFGANGYEGSNLWEICDFLNYLLEKSSNQGLIIDKIIKSIENAVKSKSETAIVGALSIEIIKCIAELEGIEYPLVSTIGSENNQQTETELPSFTTETIR